MSDTEIYISTKSTIDSAFPCVSLVTIYYSTCLLQQLGSKFTANISTAKSLSQS